MNVVISESCVRARIFEEYLVIIDSVDRGIVSPLITMVSIPLARLYCNSNNKGFPINMDSFL